MGYRWSSRRITPAAGQKGTRSNRVFHAHRQRFRGFLMHGIPCVLLSKAGTGQAALHDTLYTFRKINESGQNVPIFRAKNLRQRRQGVSAVTEQLKEKTLNRSCSWYA